MMVTSTLAPVLADWFWFAALLLALWVLAGAVVVASLTAAKSFARRGEAVRAPTEQRSGSGGWSC